MALVCLCFGVSDRRVRREIAAGAVTIDDITRRCSAGGNCHGCHDSLDELLDEQLVGTPVAVRFA